MNAEDLFVMESATLSDKHASNRYSSIAPNDVAKATKESQLQRYCLLMPNNSELMQRNENEYCVSYVEMSWSPGKCLVAHVSLVFGNWSYNSQVVVLKLSPSVLQEHFRVDSRRGRRLHSFEKLVLTPYQTLPQEIWRTFRGTFTSYSADVKFVDIPDLIEDGEVPALMLVPPLKTNSGRTGQTKRVCFPKSFRKLGDDYLELDVPLIEAPVIRSSDHIGPKCTVLADKSSVTGYNSQPPARPSGARIRKRRKKTRLKDSLVTKEDFAKEGEDLQSAAVTSSQAIWSEEQPKTSYGRSVATHEICELSAEKKYVSSEYAMTTKQCKIRMEASGHALTEYVSTEQHSETRMEVTGNPSAELSIAGRNSGTYAETSENRRECFGVKIQRENTSFDFYNVIGHFRPSYETLEVGHEVRRTNGHQTEDVNAIDDSSTEDESHKKGLQLGMRLKGRELKVTQTSSTKISNFANVAEEKRSRKQSKQLEMKGAKRAQRKRKRAKPKSGDDH